MARGTLSHARVACEGPRPTVRGAVLLPRNRPVIVARGPVPRERPYQEGSVVASPPGTITTETDL